MCSLVCSFRELLHVSKSSLDDPRQQLRKKRRSVKGAELRASNREKREESTEFLNWCLLDETPRVLFIVFEDFLGSKPRTDENGQLLNLQERKDENGQLLILQERKDENGQLLILHERKDS